jgi:hypothetical protein
MSGFHPVASGSIPGSGFHCCKLFLALLAQSVEHATFNRGVGGSSPPQGFLLVFRFGVLAHRVEQSEFMCSVRFAGYFFFALPNWRNGSAPAYGAGGCGFEPHVGLFVLWGSNFAGEGSSILPRGQFSPVSIVALYLLWVSFVFFSICRVSSAVEQSAPVRSVVSSNPAHVFSFFFLGFFVAFVVKWYHSCLPSSWRGFDSP